MRDPIKTIGMVAILLAALAVAAESANSQALFPIQKDGKYGFIDSSGGVAIPNKFDQVLRFSDGLAAARVGKVWGYVDAKGEWAIQPRFEMGLMPEFCGSGAFGMFEGKRSVLDRNGKITAVPVPQEIEMVTPCGEGFIGYEENDEWGFLDTNGNVAIKPQFEGARRFGEGLAAVANSEKKWGFIDKSGKFVIAPQFDSALWFSEGLAAVKVGDLWGFIDKSGKMIISPRLLSGAIFSEGFASIPELQGGVYRWGFIDKQGNVVVKPAYAAVSDFSNGRALIVIDGKSGYIDKLGKLVIPATLPWAGEFRNGLAAIRNSENGIEYEMYIDPTGKTVWKSKR